MSTETIEAVATVQSEEVNNESSAQTAQEPKSPESEVVIPAPALRIDADKLKQEGGGKSDIAFAHQELISKNNINIKDLPKQLKTDIQFWNATHSRLKSDRSGKIAVSLRKRSVIIANDIQDWLERDYPEKPADEVDAHIKSVEEEARKKKEQEEAHAQAEALKKKEKEEAEAKARNEKEAREKHEQEQKQRRILEARAKIKREQELTPEQKQQRAIMESLNADGKIEYKDLVKILGRNVGLSAVHVGSMILHNEYMTNFYYIHKK